MGGTDRGFPTVAIHILAPPSVLKCGSLTIRMSAFLWVATWSRSYWASQSPMRSSWMKLIILTVIAAPCFCGTSCLARGRASSVRPWIKSSSIAGYTLVVQSAEFFFLRPLAFGVSITVDISLRVYLRKIEINDLSNLDGVNTPVDYELRSIVTGVGLTDNVRLFIDISLDVLREGIPALGKVLVFSSVICALFLASQGSAACRGEEIIGPLRPPSVLPHLRMKFKRRGSEL